MATEQYLYIDIFAGCGGLSLGLCNAGWTGLFAIEKSPFAFATLKHNLVMKKQHYLWPSWLSIGSHDINEIIADHSVALKQLRGSVRLVAGGPPCQGFSSAGKRNQDDNRNKLVRSYIEFIKLVRPDAVIFENVHGFTMEFKPIGGTVEKFSDYVQEALKELGYSISHRIIDMSEYGVPQRRKRFILIGMLNHNAEDAFGKLDTNRHLFFAKKKLSPYVTCQDALCDLERRHGEIASPDTENYWAGVYGPAKTKYQEYMRRGLSEASSIAVDSHRFVKHTLEITNQNVELQAVAPRGKRLSAKNNPISRIKRRGFTILAPQMPAPTVTSIPDDLLHYEEPRILTVREHARLQSFPDWYEFKGKYTTGGDLRKIEVPRYTQVGNAVPPLFAEQIGLAIKEVLDSE